MSYNCKSLKGWSQHLNVSIEFVQGNVKIPRNEILLLSCCILQQTAPVYRLPHHDRL